MSGEPLFVLRGGHKSSCINCVDLASFHPHNTLATHVVLATSAYYLLSGDADGLISLWNLRTRRIIQQINMSEYGSIQSIKCIQDYSHELEKHVILVLVHFRVGLILSMRLSSTGQLTPLTQALSTTISPLTIGTGSFCKFQPFSPSPNLLYIAVPSLKKPDYIDIVQWPTGDPIIVEIGDVAANAGMCLSCHILCISEGLCFLVGAYDDGYVRIFELSLSSPNGSFSMVFSQRIFPVTITNLACNAEKIYACSSLKQIAVIEGLDLHNKLFENWKIVRTIPLDNEGISDLAAFPHLRLLFSAGWDTRIRMFSMDSLNQLGFLQAHMDTVLHLVAKELDGDGIPDTKRPVIRHKHVLVACGQDSLISVWNPTLMLKSEPTVIKGQN